MSVYFKMFFKKLGKGHLLPPVVICLDTGLAEGASEWAHQPFHGFARNMIKCCLFWGLLLAVMFALPMPGKEGPCGLP